MGLNYDVAMKVLDVDGSTGIKDVKIQAYFNKVNNSSSDAAWNSDIQKTTATGKTSFNLGDTSFLGSNGKIDNGDIILITVWLTDNNDVLIDDKGSKNINTITRCINFIHTVDTASSSYEEKVILLNVNNPVCNFTIPAITEVTKTGHNFNILNDSYINSGAFSVDAGEVTRSDLYQEITRYSQDLFLGLELEKTIYNYGENTIQTVGTENSNYSYVDAGDYNCNFSVYNFLGFNCYNEISYHILYNKPTINFDYTFTKLLNTDKHIGVGNDDEAKVFQLSSTNFGDSWTQIQATFDWTLSDLTLDGTDNADNYTAKDETFEPTRLYASSGNKEITLNINWNDGFDNQTETLVLTPFLDIYNISLSYDWITDKGYKAGGVYVTLGDDDFIKFTQSNSDSATQDYNSNSQWKTLAWDITKKKNDGTHDNENLTLNAGDDYNTIFNTYIRFLHSESDYAIIKETLIYWNGWEDVTKELSYNLVSKDYTITQEFHWDTKFYGLNKVITNDDDEVTLSNDSTFGPQNNQALVQEDKYEVIKNKYASYTDDALVNDDEVFTYTDLSNNPKFFVRKDGNFNVTNTIKYYNGFEIKTSSKAKTLQAKVHTPNPVISWTSRRGTGKFIEGRDDTCAFENNSYQADYYGIDKDKNSPRNLSIDWYINNYITAGNYSEINSIGGGTYSTDDENIETFLGSLIDYKPEINYWTEIASQDARIVYYYNDGFFNRSAEHTTTIETKPYLDLVPNINYTGSIPDRSTNVIFSDNSSTNEIRIIDIDWSLTDRYSDTSMSKTLRDTDNLQTWLNRDRLEEITTTINSNENHTLSQDIIRWDNGFKLKTFNKEETIVTTNYDINPDFSYSQIFNTGPEIRFTNTSTKNDGAVLLTYDLEIQDKNNDGTDAFAEYRGIGTRDDIEHTYKSVSNSPFEADVHNKEVTIFQDYDNGWDEVYDSFTTNILVKPNRISQEFILEAQRHLEDTETSDNIITGNNPILFKDASSTLRTDTDFIKSVKYIITEDC